MLLQITFYQLSSKRIVWLGIGYKLGEEMILEKIKHDAQKQSTPTFGARKPLQCTLGNLPLFW